MFKISQQSGSDVNGKLVCPMRDVSQFLNFPRPPDPPSLVLPHFVGPSGRVAEQTIEEVEEGELEKQGFHFEVVGQPVQHLDHTVVGVGAVLLVAPQQQQVGSEDG